MAKPEFTRPELVCPAGTPAGLRTAVDAGADAVYCGFRNATNARNFPGLNFTPEELQGAVAYAHQRGAKVLLAANTFPPAGQTALWKEAIDTGVALGVDAIIVADMGVADYAARTHPVSACICRYRPGPPRPRRFPSMSVNSASPGWCCRASLPSPRSRRCTIRSIARSRPSCSAISA